MVLQPQLARLLLAWRNLHCMIAHLTVVRQSCMPLKSPGGLKELCFSGEPPKLGDCSFGRSAALLMMDSSVRVLRFGSISDADMREFFETMASQPCRARIEYLSFPHDYRVDEVWDAVVECIPYFLYLKKLGIRYFPSSHAALILDSMRQNGSWVSLPDEWKYGVPFNSYDLTRLRVYRKRNKYLPTVLGIPLSANRDEGRRLSSLPSLFTVAGQTGQMCANFILIGLLSCTCSIGPDRSQLFHPASSIAEEQPNERNCSRFGAVLKAIFCGWQ
jgi:hypothetical protein